MSFWDLFRFYIIDLTKMFLVFWGICNYPLKKRKIYINICIIIGIFILLELPDFTNMSFFQAEAFSVFLIMMTIFIVFDVGFKSKFKTYVLSYFIVGFADTCIFGIAWLLFRYDAIQIDENSYNNYMFLPFNILSIGLICWIRKKKRISFGENKVSNKSVLLIIVGLFCGSFILSGLLITKLPNATPLMRKIVVAAVVIVCIAYLITCCMLLLVSDSRDKYKTLSQINQKVIEAQQKYYLLITEKQQEIKGIRHEMKNHLACMNGLYRGNKIEELGDYIKELIEETETMEDLFDTGNDIVNAILNDAENKYRKDGIEIILEGAFPRQLYISSMDLCVIFANAITNAVEAIQKINSNTYQKHYINVKISNYKNDLFINILNPVAEKVEIQDGILKTTKVDYKHHGFGTINMAKKVEKYSGGIEFENVENEFSVKIHMKNVA